MEVPFKRPSSITCRHVCAGLKHCQTVPHLVVLIPNGQPTMEGPVALWLPLIYLSSWRVRNAQPWNRTRIKLKSVYLPICIVITVSCCCRSPTTTGRAVDVVLECQINWRGRSLGSPALMDANAIDCCCHKPQYQSVPKLIITHAWPIRCGGIIDGLLSRRMPDDC